MRWKSRASKRAQAVLKTVAELRSAFDTSFHKEVGSWFDRADELFIVVRYAYAAGSKDFLFVRNMKQFESLLNRLPPRSDVIVFRNKQLPYRGIASTEMLEEVLKSIPEGEWWFLLASEDDQFSDYTSDAGRTHEELRAVFEEFKGMYIAVGFEPRYSNEDNPDMQSGIIPLPDGRLESGAY